MQRQYNFPSVVIWDIGGVLYRFITEILIEKGKAMGWPLDRLPMGPTGTFPDPYYSAMDYGEITEAEYVQRLVNELSRQGIDYLPYQDTELASPPERSATWALVEQLKNEGRRQILLTNDASTWLGDGWWDSWPHRHLFEGAIDVKDVGVRKPAVEPYLACLKQLAVRPETCIFVDDMHVNCAGAEAVGMQSHWFDISKPKVAVTDLAIRLGL